MNINEYKTLNDRALSNLNGGWHKHKKAACFIGTAASIVGGAMSNPFSAVKDAFSGEKKYCG